MSFHFGIYQATVVSRSDPQNKRRLQVTVPDVLGDEIRWAEACVAPGIAYTPHARRYSLGSVRGRER